MSLLSFIDFNLSLPLPLLWYFLITFHASPYISTCFVLFCPVFILLLPAHSHLSSFVLVFVLCLTPFVVSRLNPIWGLSVPDSFPCPFPSIPFLIVFLLFYLSPLPSGDLLPQCGFFKRSERRRHYDTEYYRAHLGVQPSEVEKQASEL